MSQPAKSLSALKIHSNGINVHRTADSRVETVDLDDPGFGTIFADHMGVMRYEQGQWQQPEVVPYGEFRCPPSMAALHYGQSVFEGMKAFRNPDGTIRAFRPRDHFERLKQSCERMCIPPVEVEKMMAMLNKLIEIDRDWVPSSRPTWVERSPECEPVAGREEGRRSRTTKQSEMFIDNST